MLYFILLSFFQSFSTFFQYPQPPRISVSDGTTSFAMLAQTLEYRHDPACGRVHALTIAPAAVKP